MSDEVEMFRNARGQFVGRRVMAPSMVGNIEELTEERVAEIQDDDYEVAKAQTKEQAFANKQRTKADQQTANGHLAGATAATGAFYTTLGDRFVNAPRKRRGQSRKAQGEYLFAEANRRDAPGPKNLLREGPEGFQRSSQRGRVIREASRLSESGMHDLKRVKNARLKYILPAAAASAGLGALGVKNVRQGNRNYKEAVANGARPTRVEYAKAYKKTKDGDSQYHMQQANLHRQGEAAAGFGAATGAVTAGYIGNEGRKMKGAEYGPKTGQFWRAAGRHVWRGSEEAKPQALGTSAHKGGKAAGAFGRGARQAGEAAGRLGDVGRGFLTSPKAAYGTLAGVSAVGAGASLVGMRRSKHYADEHDAKRKAALKRERAARQVSKADKDAHQPLQYLDRKASGERRKRNTSYRRAAGGLGTGVVVAATVPGDIAEALTKGKYVLRGAEGAKNKAIGLGRVAADHPMGSLALLGTAAGTGFLANGISHNVKASKWENKASERRKQRYYSKVGKGWDRHSSGTVAGASGVVGGTAMLMNGIEDIGTANKDLDMNLQNPRARKLLRSGRKMTAGGAAVTALGAAGAAGGIYMGRKKDKAKVHKAAPMQQGKPQERRYGVGTTAAMVGGAGATGFGAVKVGQGLDQRNMGARQAATGLQQWSQGNAAQRSGKVNMDRASGPNSFTRPSTANSSMFAAGKKQATMGQAASKQGRQTFKAGVGAVKSGAKNMKIGGIVGGVGAASLGTSAVLNSRRKKQGVAKGMPDMSDLHIEGTLRPLHKLKRKR